MLCFQYYDGKKYGRSIKPPIDQLTIKKILKVQHTFKQLKKYKKAKTKRNHLPNFGLTVTDSEKQG